MKMESESIGAFIFMIGWFSFMGMTIYKIVTLSRKTEEMELQISILETKNIVTEAKVDRMKNSFRYM